MNSFSSIVATRARTICLAGLLAACNVSAAENASTSALGIEMPKSVFTGDAQNAKDPFFPNSTRHIQVVKVVPSTSTAPSNRSSLLTLKGISGPAHQRIALINNLTFVAGEEGSVRVAGGLLKIRCVDIRENQVVVAIEGDAHHHELKLRELPKLNVSL